VEPAIFTFTRLGAQRQMTVRGIYPGGITRDLTAATTDTLYSSADTNVVTVETNGVVTATGSGATQVTISNAGRTSVVNVAVSLLPAPDVALTQSVSATQANASAPLVFTLAVTNASAEPATGVYLSDLLPAGAQFVSASASQGMWSYTNGLFACELGVLAPGSSATVTLTLAFNIGGPQTNEAVVTAVGVDANPANNVASAVVNITALPVLTIQLSGTNLVLKWPTNATGFQLEETFDLAPLSSWNSLTTNPPAIGSNYEVMLPAPPNPAFFRLNRP
jgi:uncharacterized repeat protein (TIGR01451 family)